MIWQRGAYDKYQSTEEPYESKGSRTVLKRSQAEQSAWIR
jgi:hypothetical protein